MWEKLLTLSFTVRFKCFSTQNERLEEIYTAPITFFQFMIFQHPHTIENSLEARGGIQKQKIASFGQKTRSTKDAVFLYNRFFCK